jgi:hypothetical protein
MVDAVPEDTPVWVRPFGFIAHFAMTTFIVLSGWFALSIIWLMALNHFDSRGLIDWDFGDYLFAIILFVLDLVVATLAIAISEVARIVPLLGRVWRNILELMSRALLFSVLLIPLFCLICSLILFRLVLFLLPLHLLLPTLKWIPDTVDNLFLWDVAEVKDYLTDNCWSAGVRSAVATEVGSLLKRDEITDIAIVGHSLGGLISYEYLTLATAVGASDPIDSKQVTLVTIGSALNRAEQLRLKPNRPVPQLQLTSNRRWVNIYSDLDPVTAGALKTSLIGTTNAKDANFQEYSVNNTGLALGEHGSYFGNVHQVVPCLFATLNRLDGSAVLLNPKQTHRHLARIALSQMSWLYAALILLILITIGIWTFAIWVFGAS